MKQAIVLAGGHGERMKEEYPNIQKCMLPINGIPLLQYTITKLLYYGYEQILLYGDENFKQIYEHFMDNKYVRTICCTRVCGTGGGLKWCKPFIKGNFLLHYGDIFSLAGEMRELNKNDMIMVAHKTLGSRLTFGTDHLLKKIEEKPKIKKEVWGNGSVFYCTPKILDYVKLDTDISGDIIPAMLKDNCKILVEPYDKFHIDCGTPKNYRKALKWAK